MDRAGHHCDDRPRRVQGNVGQRSVKMNSIQKTARFAGLLYLALAALSAFGLVYVPSMIIVPGDAAATANNIVASESLFRLGVVSNLAAFTVNVFVAVLLYKLLEPVSKSIASLMVILIMVGLAIGMLNELNQFAALLTLGADNLTPTQSQALASLFLDIYEHGFTIAHIFWGLWLFPMGYLICRSGFLPKVVGILLIIAGMGYLVDFTLFLLFPDVTLTVSNFTFIGEVALIFWLLIKGVNVEQWNKRTHKSDTTDLNGRGKEREISLSKA
ncbi:MAG: DUF4386 domain-containing protein [Rubrobacteraceae bacterium]|nr:DUF4386 domain-containing protein [Rubrobacteraceae bacterium]